MSLGGRESRLMKRKKQPPSFTSEPWKPQRCRWYTTISRSWVAIVSLLFWSNLPLPLNMPLGCSNKPMEVLILSTCFIHGTHLLSMYTGQPTCYRCFYDLLPQSSTNFLSLFRNAPSKSWSSITFYPTSQLWSFTIT